METSTSTYTPQTPHPFLSPQALNNSRGTPVGTENDLVATLRNRLSTSRSKLKRWVEEQKAVCDTVTNRYQSDRDTYQSQIDSKVQSVLAWQMEKGLSISGNDQAQLTEEDDSDNKHHEEEENSLKTSIDALKEKVTAQRDELEALKREKEVVEEEEPAFEPFDDPENPTFATFEELQTIIKGYQDLSGLSFEKAENERLRFFLKGLNPENREEQCSFLLSTTDDDLYLVEQCEPPIPEGELGILIDELNDSEDLGKFFQGIRSLWKGVFDSQQEGDSSP